MYNSRVATLGRFARRVRRDVILDVLGQVQRNFQNIGSWFSSRIPSFLRGWGGSAEELSGGEDGDGAADDADHDDDGAAGADGAGGGAADPLAFAISRRQLARGTPQAVSSPAVARGGSGGSDAPVASDEFLGISKKRKGRLSSITAGLLGKK